MKDWAVIQSDLLPIVYFKDSGPSVHSQLEKQIDFLLEL